MRGSQPPADDIASTRLATPPTSAFSMGETDTAMSLRQQMPFKSLVASSMYLAATVSMRGDAHS